MKFYFGLERFAGFGKPVKHFFLLIPSFYTRTHTTTDLIFLDVPQQLFEFSTSIKADPQRALLALQRRVPTLANGKQFRANATNARSRRY